jgi:E3 ubiquitin-protein ligase UBR7
LAKHPQLLEEEEAYEPPVSEDGENADGSTVGSGSLLDRGERALTNMDRVRAIEGVMAYNHLKEKLKPFFKEFAESGKAISAEDIKAHFAKIRGDEEAIRQAGEAAASSGDNRREESGY